MPSALITGGTGMIGKELTELLLQKGYEVIILTRRKDIGQWPPVKGIRYAQWDVEKQTIDASAIRDADYIIHLAGAGIADKRWTAKRKKEIIESRTKSSELISRTLEENPNKVKVVVSASAVGWYGPDISNLSQGFKETEKASNDFLGETCKLWEESIDSIAAMGKRLVKLRTGIVLSQKGGALKEFMKPLRLGIAAILGNGKQIISWIHIEDVCRMYLEAIENERMDGVYNAVAPKPVSNKVFLLELAKQMKGKFCIPIYVPSFILKLVFGEMSIEILKSATVSAEKIRTKGFQFLYPSVESALNELLLRS